MIERKRNKILFYIVYILIIFSVIMKLLTGNEKYTILLFLGVAASSTSLYIDSRSREAGYSLFYLIMAIFLCIVGILMFINLFCIDISFVK